MYTVINVFVILCIFVVVKTYRGEKKANLLLIWIVGLLCKNCLSVFSCPLCGAIHEALTKLQIVHACTHAFELHVCKL